MHSPHGYCSRYGCSRSHSWVNIFLHSPTWLLSSHLFSVWTYLPENAPDFHEGNSLNLATSCMIFVLGIVGALYVRWENAKRDRGEREYRLQGVGVEEVERLGHLHPDFRYQMWLYGFGRGEWLYASTWRGWASHERHVEAGEVGRLPFHRILYTMDRI